MPGRPGSGHGFKSGRLGDHFRDIFWSANDISRVLHGSNGGPPQVIVRRQRNLEVAVDYRP
jgi:hypothetical protein